MRDARDEALDCRDIATTAAREFEDQLRVKDAKLVAARELIARILEQYLSMMRRYQNFHHRADKKSNDDLGVGLVFIFSMLI